MTSELSKIDANIRLIVANVCQLKLRADFNDSASKFEVTIYKLVACLNINVQFLILCFGNFYFSFTTTNNIFEMAFARGKVKVRQS